LTVIEEVMPYDGLEKAETCRLIVYILVLCVTVRHEIHAD
jgi:hypothetical protein